MRNLGDFTTASALRFGFGLQIHMFKQCHRKQVNTWWQVSWCFGICCPFRRLHAFALIFKTKLHGTFDAELDDPTGWWSRMDAPQLLPYLTRLALALLREEPDSRSLPTQGKATSTPPSLPRRKELDLKVKLMVILI